MFQSENKVLQARFSGGDAMADQIGSSSIDQIMTGIFTQADSDIRLSEGERVKLYNIIKAKFLQSLIPMRNKLKRSEATVMEYKGKYRDKILNFIEKLEDGKYLAAVTLQANEAMARCDNEQIPATLIVFKEELERKKETVKQKQREIIAQHEANQAELRKIFEEYESQMQSDLPMFGKEAGGEDLMDDMGAIREENEKLKSKLQTQNYEIAALNTQLKLASAVEETRRQTPVPPNREIKSSRSLRMSKEISRTSYSRVQGKYNVFFLSHDLIDDEEEVSKNGPEGVTMVDLMLMLQSQASSLEILLTNGY